MADGQLTHVPALSTEAERKTSPVYNELLPRVRGQDGLLVRLDGPEASRIVWSIGDPVVRDGWTSERVETVERLLPHLRHFVAVRHALLKTGALGASLVELLDNVRAGVIQLDRRARLVAVNDRARALLRRSDGLRDEGGRLRAALPKEDAALQGLIARALPLLHGPGEGGSMPLSRPNALSRLVVHVSLVHDAGVESGRGVGALVLAVDPADRTGFDPQRVGKALGQTFAESRVAAAFPYPLRFLFATRPAVLTHVLSIVYRAISTFLIRRAGLRVDAGARTGAVTLIQRFGSALNLNVHLHMLFVDVVYTFDEERPRFRRGSAPSQPELQRLLRTITTRVTRAHLTRYHGVFAPNFKHRHRIIPNPVHQSARAPHASRPAPMSWMQRLERVFRIDIEHCGVCGGTLRVVACIEIPEIYREDPHPSRRAQHRRHQPPPRTAAPCAASPTPGLPITDAALTAPAGAPQPRCASPPAPPRPPPTS